MSRHHRSNSRRDVRDDRDLKGTRYVFGDFPDTSESDDDDETYDNRSSFDDTTISDASFYHHADHHRHSRRDRRSHSNTNRQNHPAGVAARRGRARADTIETFESDGIDADSKDDDYTSVEDDDSIGWNYSNARRSRGRGRRRHNYEADGDDEDSSDSSDDEGGCNDDCHFFLTNDENEGNFFSMCIPDFIPEMRDGPPQDIISPTSIKSYDTDKTTNTTNTKNSKALKSASEADVENEGEQVVVNKGKKMSFMHIVKTTKQEKAAKAPSSDLDEILKTPSSNKVKPSRFKLRSHRGGKKGRKERERIEAEAEAAAAAAAEKAERRERRSNVRVTRITVTQE